MLLWLVDSWAWNFILEIYIDSERLDIIKWVVLIEWKLKCSFIADHTRPSLGLHWLRVVISWPRLQFHLTVFCSVFFEALIFRCKTHAITFSGMGGINKFWLPF